MMYRKKMIDFLKTVSMCVGTFVVIGVGGFVLTVILAVLETAVAAIGVVVGLNINHYPSWAGWRLTRRVGVWWFDYGIK